MKRSTAERFLFADEPPFNGPKTLRVLVPVGIKTKQDLLASIDAGLSFPDYFGNNWDALWECICDFTAVQNSSVTG